MKGFPGRKKILLYLDDKGEKEAEKIKKEIEEKNILIKTENGVDETKLGSIGDYVNGPNSYLFALNNLDNEGILDLTDLGQKDIFINRETEISTLKKNIKREESENINTLLIEGVTGVGKTRLVKEIKRYTKEVGIDFYGGEEFYESIQPFSQLQKIFSEILAKKPKIIDDEDVVELFKSEGEGLKEKSKELDIADKYLFNELKKALENFASNDPYIMFIDNLQWIDPATSRLLEFLTEEIKNSSLLILGAYRKEEMNNPNSKKSIDAIIHSNHSKTVEIEPFDWKNTRKLLISKIGRNDVPGKFVEMIYEVTDGVPLFVEAFIDKMLKDGILNPLKNEYPSRLDEIKLPSEVKELYDNKFKELGKKEKEVLQLCSCFDNDFSKDLIFKAVKGEKNEIKKTIENLKRNNFLEDNQKGRSDFKLEMTRFFLYKTLSDSRRKELHKKLAQSLKGIDEEEVVDYHLKLGKHLEVIDKFKEAIKVYLKGSDKAKKNYENDTAVQLYERALKILEEKHVKGIDKIKIHEDLSGVLERKEKYSEALDHLKKAKKETEDRRRLLSLNRKIAGCLRKTNQYDKASQYIEEGLEILSKADEISYQDEKEKCRLLKEKGMVCLRKNEFEECQNIFNDMKNLSDKIESKKDKAEAIHYLGTIAYYRSDFDQAKEHLQRSIELRKEVDDLEGLLKSYNNLGVVFRNLQEPNKALEFYKKANKIKKELGSEEDDLSALENIGIIYYDLGELDKSIEYYQKCLEIEKKVEDEHGMAATLDNIGVSFFGKGEFDKALEHHERSLELKKKFEDRSGISYSLYNKGLTYRGKGKFEKSLDLLKESLEIRKELEDKLNIGYSQLWIGILYLDMGKLDKSSEYLKKALDIFKETKSDHGMGMTLTYLGRLNIFQDSLDEAKKYLEHSEKIKSKLEEEGIKLIVDRHFAEYYLEKNRLEKSLAYCQEALRKAKRTDMKNQLGKCRKVLGKLYCEKNVFSKGQKEFQKALKIFNETGDKKNKAEVLFEWGDRLIERGEEERGNRKKSEAIKLFEELDMDISSF